MTGYYFFKTIFPAFLGFFTLVVLLVWGIRYSQLARLKMQREKLRKQNEYLKALETYHEEAREVFKKYLVGDITTDSDKLFELIQPIKEGNSLEAGNDSSYPYGTRNRRGRPNRMLG